MIEREYKEYLQVYCEISKIGLRLQDLIVKAHRNDQLSNFSTSAFSKLILQYVSLLKLMPKDEESIFDLSSLSALSRSIIELSNWMFFLGIDEVAKEENEFRLLLLKFLSTKEELGVINQLGNHSDSKSLDNQRIELIENPTFINLVKERKIDGINDLQNLNNAKYPNRREINKRRKIDEKTIEAYYKMTSVFLHNSPASLYNYLHYLINYDQESQNDLKNSIAVTIVPSAYVALSIIEISVNLSTNLLDKEKELLNQFANLLNANSK